MISERSDARIVDSTEGVKNIRVSRFPWRDEADRCSTNRLARNRSRIHPIKEVTHSHIEPHQQPRYRENATLRRSGRTKHGRPVCRFKSASTHTHTHAHAWKGQRVHMHRMYRTFTRFANTYRRLVVSLGDVMNDSSFRYEWTESFKRLWASFQRHHLIGGDTVNVGYFASRIGRKFSVDLLDW